MIEKLKEYKKWNIYLLLFFVFLFVYIFLGLCLTYGHESIKASTWDIIYNADTPRIVADLGYIIDPGKHYRIAVHPLMLVLLQPLTSLINAFVGNIIYSIVIFQSIISACNVCLIYKIINNITDNNKASILWALIYGFSFSTFIFTSVPESYIFSMFFLLLLLNYLLELHKNPEKNLSLENILIISFYLIAYIGIVLSNIIIAPFIIFLFLIFHYNKNFAKTFIDFAKIILFTLVGLAFLVLVQKLAYSSSPVFLKGIYDSIIHKSEYSELTYVNTNISLQSIKNIIIGLFINSFTALKFSPEVVHFSYRNGLADTSFSISNKFLIWQFISIIITYLFVAYSYIKNFFKKYSSFIYIFCTPIILQTIFSLFYCNKTPFLFSQNIIGVLIILMAILTQYANRVIRYIVLIQLLVYEIIINFFTIFKINYYLNLYSDKVYNVFIFMIYAAIITTIAMVIMQVLKVFVKDKFFNLQELQKYKIYTSLYLLVIVIWSVFVSLHHGKL